jgi:PEP-CTERM motif
MSRRALLAAATTLFAGITSVSAGGVVTVYDNPWTSGGGGNCGFSTVCAANFGLGDVFAAQSFKLTSTQTITAASFTETDLGRQPFAATWMFYEADGAGGLPGSELASGTSSDGLFGAAVGSVAAYTVHQENFNLSTSVTLGPGEYYFAVQAISPVEETYLQTASLPKSAETFDGGATWVSGYGGAIDGVAVGLYNGTFTGVPNPNTIPEPSTWAMMLLGFVGLGFVRYRASRADAV